MARITLRVALLVASTIGAPGQVITTQSLVPGKPFGAGYVTQLSFSPDGRLLLVVTTIGFQIRDADSGRVLNTVVDGLPVEPRSTVYREPWMSEICWSRDGTRIARAATGIEIWDPFASKPERILLADAMDKAPHELAWSPDGNQLAARSESGIVMWDLKSGAQIKIPEKPPNSGVGIIGGFSWSPDGGQLAIVVGDAETERVDFWDVRRMARVRRIRVAEKGAKPKAAFRPVNSVVQIEPDQSKADWSPDGRVPALYSGFSGLSVWSPRTNSLLWRLPSRGRRGKAESHRLHGPRIAT